MMATLVSEQMNGFIAGVTSYRSVTDVYYDMYGAEEVHYVGWHRILCRNEQTSHLFTQKRIPFAHFDLVLNSKQ